MGTISVITCPRCNNTYYPADGAPKNCPVCMFNAIVADDLNMAIYEALVKRLRAQLAEAKNLLKKSESNQCWSCGCINETHTPDCELHKWLKEAE